MELDHDRIKELVSRPGESLAVEVKTWIDPDTLEGQAKIVRTALALRNHGGGYLVFGFNNETLEPDTPSPEWNVREKFHIDKIQGLITKYASAPFEIAIEFVERDELMFPVMVVPTGVKTPVASKADLVIDGARPVATHDIYVRTLRSNNTPSTAKASWKDWEGLATTCFDNREADIGRFLRRHLGSMTPSLLQYLSEVTTHAAPSLSDQLKELLKEGNSRFWRLVNERLISLPQVGWWEVALIIEGDIPTYNANKRFLDVLNASNPELTGWPIWLDSRGFANSSERPYVFDERWESLIVDLDGFPSNIDFQQLDPIGRFYLRWALQDDVTNSARAPTPNVSFDFGLPILRCAEAIAVGIAFAKGMGCNPDDCTLNFAFRWTGLKDRELSSWAQPGRYISPGRKAYQDQVTIIQRVPLDTPLSAIGGLLATTLKPLYEIFDGFELSSSVIEELSTRLIERRL